MRSGGFTLILCILVGLASCEMGGYSTENPDAFCKKLLAEEGPKELRAWLKEGPNTLGELSTNSASIRLAEEIYGAGAPHAFGIGIEKHAEFENTGKLVVELPSDASGRKRVLAWAAKIAHEQGFDAYSDVGQQYVFVMLD